MDFKIGDRIKYVSRNKTVVYTGTVLDNDYSDERVLVKYDHIEVEVAALRISLHKLTKLEKALK